MTELDPGRPVAVVVARAGRLPVGADEAVAEAGGQVVVLGTGTVDAAESLLAAERAWCAETGAGLRPAALASSLAPLLAGVPLVVLPSSPDGRDLGPRLAAVLGLPFIAHAVAVSVDASSEAEGRGVCAEVSRLDDRVLVPVTTDGPAVATLVPGSRTVPPRRRPTSWEPETIDLSTGTEGGVAAPPDPEVIDVLEPDPATMDLADAPRVVAGGAGLASGAPDQRARATFDLLIQVAAALGASAGATRVATDAGWIGYERQIGTTGVAVHPDLYIAFGVSGATQHVGGLGDPRHVVSVNLDPSCPMTAMADLGLVTDGPALLVELARRLEVGVPAGVVVGTAGEAEGTR
ncbi:MAG TPA: mycofactocin-associated electron transfer flavoprotein alpha subunit [Acidimicrobiales bacterium]|nr:mycofactocin-associated electron transfer flavoprotein alpha subunit [Acidimicrobiales bacterium]